MSSAELKKLNVQKGALKAQLTRFTKFLDSLDQDEILIDQLQHRFDAVQNILTKFHEIKIEIDCITDSPQDEDEVEEFVTRFMSQITRAKQHLRSAVSSNTSNVARQRTVQLPQIPLKQFSGDIQQWPQFYHSYNSLIHTNSDLTTIQKYQYLLASVTGEPADVISTLVFAETNYEVAWNILLDRYKSERALTLSHLKGLLDPPIVQKDSYKSSRAFLDNILKHYQALLSLDDDVSHWDTLLLYLLVPKLDVIAKNEWQHIIQKIKKPKINNFIDFLKERCNMLQDGELSKRFNTVVSCSEQKGALIKQSRSYTHVTTKLSCPICKEEHFLWACKHFKELSLENRQAEVKKLRLCTNCLRSGHTNYNCKSGKCRVCNKRHNSILHSDSYKRPINSNENSTVNSQISLNDNTPHDDNRDQTASVSASCVTADEEPTILLATACVSIYTSDNQTITCRALLDNCSQSCLITANLTKRLALTPTRTRRVIAEIGNSLNYLNQKVTIKNKIIIHGLRGRVIMLGHRKNNRGSSSKTNFTKGAQYSTKFKIGGPKIQ